VPQWRSAACGARARQQPSEGSGRRRSNPRPLAWEADHFPLNGAVAGAAPQFAPQSPCARVPDGVADPLEREASSEHQRDIGVSELVQAGRLEEGTLATQEGAHGPRRAPDGPNDLLGGPCSYLRSNCWRRRIRSTRRAQCEAVPGGVSTSMAAADNRDLPQDEVERSTVSPLGGRCWVDGSVADGVEPSFPSVEADDGHLPGARA
jgi:hypothetical protein